MMPPTPTPITVGSDGLLRLVTPDGDVHDGLADDEAVRLAVKWAKRAATRETLSRVAAVRAAAPGPVTATKCSACGSGDPERRRPMMGVSGSCRDRFHDTSA
jgi:hypothetical protein